MTVEHSSGLHGTLKIPGSKNSVQALIAASCLADDIVTLRGVPILKDLDTIFDICTDIGMSISMKDNHELSLDPRQIETANLDPLKTSTYRAAYYFVGALLAKFGRVSLSYPGGDWFGNRPIDQHYKGLQALGATVELYREHYVVEAKALTGADIRFDVETMGGTINLMLASARARGVTVLRNAARDPEVIDVANMLIKMGVRVSGAGTDVIHIEGSNTLSGCTHTVIPDRIVAGTYLMAVAVTGGEITVSGVIPSHLGSCIGKLRDIGLVFEVADESITAVSEGKLRLARVRTSAYPGFPTDLQQPLTAVLLGADGESIIIDHVFKRFSHVPQLQRMGAEDLIITMGWTPSNESPRKQRQIAKAVHESKVPHIYWATEDPGYTSDFSLPLIRRVRPDFVFTIDRPTVQKYRKLGIRAAYLDFGFDPSVHHPTPVFRKYKANAALIANGYIQLYKKNLVTIDLHHFDNS